MARAQVIAGRPRAEADPELRASADAATDAADEVLARLHARIEAGPAPGAPATSDGLEFFDVMPDNIFGGKKRFGNA